MPETKDRRAIRQVQHRLTEAEVQQIGEQYQAGASTYALAAEWKINRETVTLALRRAGAQIRARGELTPQQTQEAQALQAHGWSLIRLGQRFGVDPKTMKKRLTCAPAPSAPGPDSEPIP